MSEAGHEELFDQILKVIRYQGREAFLLVWGWGGGTSQKEGSYESLSAFFSACLLPADIQGPKSVLLS